MQSIFFKVKVLLGERVVPMVLDGACGQKEFMFVSHGNKDIL